MLLLEVESPENDIFSGAGIITIKSAQVHHGNLFE